MDEYINPPERILKIGRDMAPYPEVKTHQAFLALLQPGEVAYYAYLDRGVYLQTMIMSPESLRSVLRQEKEGDVVILGWWAVKAS